MDDLVRISISPRNSNFLLNGLQKAKQWRPAKRLALAITLCLLVSSLTQGSPTTISQGCASQPDAWLCCPAEVTPATAASAVTLFFLRGSHSSGIVISTITTWTLTTSYHMANTSKNITNMRPVTIKNGNNGDVNHVGVKFPTKEEVPGVEHPFPAAPVLPCLALASLNPCHAQPLSRPTLVMLNINSTPNICYTQRLPHPTRATPNI
ncbi:hypothetical protein E2C01_034918 [Portunus trituberculatus]|uniref:Uncharacterized protein n=1 Tax=Portunus trituberculatus TaxID=210409 RepID=A0A5B7F1T7_PORTR|nr:hypothetical protein [Portunus trituberculatus]